MLRKFIWEKNLEFSLKIWRLIDMKLGTYLNLTNSLSMTPELQQAVKLLQLSALDLNAEIQKIFEENPLIEKKMIAKAFLENVLRIIYIILV